MAELLKPPACLNNRSSFRSYSSAIRFLYDLGWFGAKFGLTNTLKLAALSGNPHLNLRFVHVAGTNGKGSTCAMLEGIYRAAGLRVGLFTSPHLVSFAERIQVNRRKIPEAEVTRLVNEIGSLLRKFPAGHCPTFFEVVTLMALRYFARQKCDLVIWETGLGGRLDATNIVTPLASVITNIQYDHEKWLGHTLSSIAAEKAGIIKPGVPILTTTDEPLALKVIEETARANNSPFTVVGPCEKELPPLDTIELPLPGAHQRRNAALAVATVRALSAQIPVNDAAIRLGLSRLHWPGRLQMVVKRFGQRILLDGAHNVAGARALKEALKDFCAKNRPTLILGILADKHWADMCAVLAPMANRILLVPVQSKRTAPPHQLVEACRAAQPAAPVSDYPSLSHALEAATRDRLIVIAGSLYLVGEAMELLGLQPKTRQNERRLNEWTAENPASRRLPLARIA